MDDDYYSIDAILAENHVRELKRVDDVYTSLTYLRRICLSSQKLTCTFTLDVPNLGYLEGGSEPDVSIWMASSPVLRVSSCLLKKRLHGFGREVTRRNLAE